MKRKTLIITITTVILAAAGGLTAFKYASSGDEGTVVQIDLAYADSLSEIVTASGRIQPKTKVNISSQVSGEIKKLYVKEGNIVISGQSLILLDTVQLKSDVAQARYSLDEITARAGAAWSQLEKDRLEKERQSELFKQRLTSERSQTDANLEFDRSKANHNALLSQIKTQRARLDKARDNLSKTLILAPMDGVITYLKAEVGEIAQAQTSFTQGKTLMIISDLSIFEVDVDVDETEIAKISLGQQVVIRVDAFRDSLFDGSVVEIANSARVTGEGTENFTTDFQVKIRFADTEATIRPGMSATVDITTAIVDNAVLIPYASIVTREFDSDSLDKKAEESSNATLISSVQAEEITSESNNANAKNGNKKKEKIKKTGVFIIENGKAKFVEVVTGIADERNIVAISGVSSKDTIISGSYKTLRKLDIGDAVTVEEDEDESSDND